MMPDILRIHAAEGLPIVLLPAGIDHVGYEGDQTAKHHRNLPLLRRAVDADPDRTYLWFHLGSVLLALDRTTEAEEAWARGVAASRSCHDPGAIDLIVFANLARLRLLDGRPVPDLVEDMVAMAPDDPLTAWVDAHQLMHDHRWDEAIERIEPLTRIDPDTVLHPVLAYERSLFGAQAFDALGCCRFQLGDDEEAAAWFRRAEAADPDDPAHRVKRSLAEARAGSAARSR